MLERQQPRQKTASQTEPLLHQPAQALLQKTLLQNTLLQKTLLQKTLLQKTLLQKTLPQKTLLQKVAAHIRRKLTLMMQL